MQYQLLGHSTLRVSVIGFGCMSLGKEQRDNDTLLLNAVDKGINFFDTADLYDNGWNEETVGKALKEVRKKIVLATKVGNQWRADGTGWDWNPTKKYIIQAVEKSLTRLQTDYIDLYQLHGGTINDPIDDTIEAFELLQQQGKILHYGISSIRPNVIKEYCNRSAISTVMMQYSLLDRRAEEECVDLLKQQQIPILARGSLAQGLLINKAAKDYLGHTAPEVAAIAKEVQLLSNDQRTVAQTALLFALQQPAITTVIAGIRNQQQLNELTASVKCEPFTSQELLHLQTIAKPHYYKEHR